MTRTRGEHMQPHQQRVNMRALKVVEEIDRVLEGKLSAGYRAALEWLRRKNEARVYE